ncbi:hypothetical protein BST97_12140 [Nonlabens spongiae]|uniref:Integrase n=1 Tax=Nonlabens spongiae TaxID=331648 RepID=A0A1W6MM56_9FLAO|nr:phage integrase SAM-like domain-containing protein [Nonlabens spongiae]ARN78680.1 hypothetical protein BST97_12140 [Nonlabens spongiae]
MATVTYRTKSGSGSKHNIYLRIKDGDKYECLKSTGYSIDPDFWERGFVKDRIRDADAKSLRKKLTKLRDEVIDNLEVTPANLIDSKWLENRIASFKGEVSKNEEISDYLTDYVQRIIDTSHLRKNDRGGYGLSEGRLKSYRNLLNMVKRYQGDKNYRIKDVNKLFLERFADWMLTDQGYSKNYALKIIRDTKTVCKDALGNNIEVDNTQFAFVAPTITNEKPLYLNFEELSQIQKTRIDKNYLINARKWLVLGCHIGQRGSDLLSLTAENYTVRNGVEVIELTQQKTGKAIIIPLPKEAREVIESGFPHKISLSKFNKYLKEIAELAEIDTPTHGRKSTGKGKKRELGTFPKHDLISSHVCRRSYASNYYGTMPTPLILQITGHSTEKMLLKYIGKPSIDYVQQIADHYRLLERKAEKTAKMNVIKNTGTN